MPTISSSEQLTLQAEETALPRDKLAKRTDSFTARASWTRGELLAFQRDRLKTALGGAAANSRYYARTIGPLVAGNAPFTEFPALSKRQFMDHFDDIVTDRRLNRRMIEAHIEGPDAGRLLLGEYRCAATGGTSGERGVFVYNEEAWLDVMAVIGRSQRTLGIKPDTRSLGIGAPSPIHLSNRFFAESRVSRPGSPRLDLTMPLAEIVAALNAYQPEAITTYPSFYRVLAQEQKAGRLKIAPRILRSGAETLLPEVVQLVRDIWGVPLYNSYACTEAGAIAGNCGHRDGLHIAEDHVVLEVVDDEGRAVPDGVQGSRCLITTLGNPMLPLVRYELSDLVTVTREPCSCGQPFARIVSIQGRREERLRFAGRDGGSVELGIIVLKSPLIATEGVDQFQIQQRDGKLVIRIAPANGVAADILRQRVELRIREALEQHGVPPPPIEVTLVGSIARAGSAAKERQFVP